MHSVIIKIFYSAKITNLIYAFITSYIFPNFLFHIIKVLCQPLFRHLTKQTI